MQGNLKRGQRKEVTDFLQTVQSYLVYSIYKSMNAAIRLSPL
jgi:hypothetical protein